MKLFDDEAEEEHLWKVRESGLGATARIPGEKDAWEGWEDSAVPPDKVGPYLRDLRSLLKKYGYNCSLYGHFGQGCIHTRIDFDLKTVEGVKHFREFLNEAGDLVVSYGGSISGEHGDGQSKAALLPKMFGNELVRAFGEFKAIWDPDNKMNPHKVVDPYLPGENLRLGPHYHPIQRETHFKFPGRPRQLLLRDRAVRGHWRVPQGAEWHHVPELHGDQGGDALDAWAHPPALRDVPGRPDERRLEQQASSRSP